MTIGAEIRRREARLKVLEIADRFDADSKAPQPVTLRQELRALAAEARASLHGEVGAARRVLGAGIRGRLSFKPVRTGEADGYEITSAATAAEILRGKTFVEVASPPGFEPVFWP